jgi:phage tail-like protein
VDVNGTRFHLVKGRADWRRWAEERRAPSGALTLTEPGEFVSAEFDEAARALRLRSRLVLFVSARGGAALQPEQRRGAAADAFGNWYWVSSDRRRVFWRPLGSNRSTVFWSPEMTAARCEPSADFAPVGEPEPPRLELAGLAVTTNHYLVVGDAAGGRLLIFDLHAGGAPVVLRFPAGVPFEPFDIAAAPRGGVWVLDRKHKTYWGLDRDFCVLSEGAGVYEIAPEETEVFHAEGGTASVRPARRFPTGFALPAGVVDPVAVEGLADGSVLVLDSPAYSLPAVSPPPASRVLHMLRADAVGAPLELNDPSVETVDELGGKVSRGLSVVGYDFAFLPDGGGGTKGTLRVVEREGNQCVDFSLDLAASPPTLSVAPGFRPMHYFGSRALVAHRGETFYDVVSGDTARDRAVRWVQLQEIDEPRYSSTAVIQSAALDGRERGCVWHRLMLDACIPAESSVEVWTRAHDDRALLEQVEWSPEPAPYLRAAGPELPFFDAFPQYASVAELPAGTGTWELLFQRARGRFAQVRLVLRGNGRTTPRLSALRAYYPRFSYPRNYLPKVFQDDAGSADFLERMLANEEGFYTDIEGRIGDVSLLFDPRGAPPEALDWLAGWVGIVLDPLWAGIQSARQERTRNLPASARAKPYDRRRLFIQYARKLYDRRGTQAGIRFALMLLLDPCLEVLLERLKRAAVRPEEPASASLLEELRRYGLLELYGQPEPPGVPRTRLRPSLDQEEFEDLLYDYMLSPKRPSKVRIVERYRTRGGRRLQEGDVSVGESEEEESKKAAGEAPDAYAHQFSVLVPEELTPEEEAMTRRVTELEKPAHTSFDVRRYWDFFRVGEGRVGIDTVLGEESRFVETILGRSYLAEGYLRPSHPADTPDRVVSDRDRLGGMPPL